jgi:hypothetical protein
MPETESGAGKGREGVPSAKLGLEAMRGARHPKAIVEDENE